MKLILENINLSAVASCSAEEYTRWINVGFILKNTFNNDTVGYNLWIIFSSRSEKYDEDAYLKFWNSTNYRDNESALTIGTLIQYIKHDNKEIYNRLNVYSEEPQNFKTIQLNKQHLDFEDKLIKKHVRNWIDNKKILAIKSAYGTGKTTVVKNIIKKYKFKRIIWVTHRLSMTTSLMGDIKEELLFYSYTDGDTDANRIIT